MLDDNTQFPMVPSGPIRLGPEPGTGAPVRLPSKKHRWWAVPLALVGIATPITALVCNGIQIDHWAVAPGEASPVGSRLDFENLPDGVVEDDSPGQFLFVTVTGAHLNVLQFALGGNDDDVRVLTREERFGKDDPGQERQIGLQMMRDAKDVAEYVAYRRLGLDARLRAGEVVVAHLLCLNGELTKSEACDTPAPAAGFLERGFTITAVDGVPTPTVEDLAPVMASRKPGDEVTVTYRPIQGGEEKTATFRTISSQGENGSPSRALIGFISHDTYSVQLPFRAEIDTDSIGGPSAGLAFTLSLIDRLSPGSLTGDQKVAVTGTIQDDGSVGAIGGLRQKVVAVRRSGARFMLVPRAQGDEGIDGLVEARRAAGDELEIVPVANLEEALAALAARGGTPIPAVAAT